ncbi:hypothetical protein ZWY2020_000269 [Hordeum vulgare]|nr:hypothetical protein ZWY2020_000269 [Hordeum vulgare]
MPQQVYEPRAKATLVFGGESFAISCESGALSEQLAAMRVKSMVVLKGYITKHNVSNDVPDESIEGLSDEEGDALAKTPAKKYKKQKRSFFGTESQIIVRHYCTSCFCNKSLCSSDAQGCYLITCSCRESYHLSFCRTHLLDDLVLLLAIYELQHKGSLQLNHFSNVGEN